MGFEHRKEFCEGEAIDRCFNNIGSDWELVAVTSCANSYTLFFKREIKQEHINNI